jgi:hypothetical protein
MASSRFLMKVYLHTINAEVGENGAESFLNFNTAYGSSMYYVITKRSGSQKMAIFDYVQH